MKDHLTQGLSFEMSHCAEEPTLSWIDVLLGYLGFVAAGVPLVRFLQTPEECREGLVSPLADR